MGYGGVFMIEDRGIKKFAIFLGSFYYGRNDKFKLGLRSFIWVN
jgi:hypothetical protein